MTDKLRTLKCGGREICWVLTRKSVKNLNLRIKPDGIVYVSANSRVTISHIEDFIREKSEVIFSAIDRFAVRSAAPELPERGKAYQSGDTLRYFGEDYTLSIQSDVRDNVYTDGGKIIVHTRDTANAGRLLEKFYAEEIHRRFDDFNRRTYDMFLAKGYDVPMADMQIRKMKSRWGSCHYADRKIVMNSRLVLYPEMCTAYVFIHEYAHFIFPDHSRNFYGVVASLMPDYKICVNILKG